MADPLLWNTLDTASRWLSEETKSEWTIERIIDYCINDLERYNAEDYRSAYIKVALPKNIKIGFYRYAREMGETSKCFLTVANGELIKLGGSGVSRFTASLYRKNLHDLLIQKETEICQVCFGDDSRGYWLFELFEPLNIPPPEKIEIMLPECEDRLPSEVIAGFGHPLRVTLDMVGISKESLKTLLLHYKKTNHSTEEAKVTSKGHTTKEMNVLDEAKREFWEGKDPNMPPKKEVVVGWIRERGISQRIAEVMDTMLRPPKARIGGNKLRIPKSK